MSTIISEADRIRVVCTNCNEAQMIYPAVRAIVGSKIICLHCEATLALRVANGEKSLWLYAGTNDFNEARASQQ